MGRDRYAFTQCGTLSSGVKGKSRVHFVCCQQPSDSSTTAATVAAQLRRDLPVLFNTDGCPSHFDLFSDKVVFRDPVTSFEGVRKYRSNIALLRNSPLFERTQLDTFDVRVTSPSTVTTRWSMAMTVRLLPWRPRITFTGESIYELNDNGEVIEHIDLWDSLTDAGNNSVVSREAVADVVAQFTPQRHFHTLGARPSFILLRRTKDVEIRDYGPVILSNGGVEMVGSVIESVVREGVTLVVRDGGAAGRPVGIVAVASLEDGVSFNESAKNIVDTVRKQGIAKVLDKEAPLLVRYKKNNVWDNVMFWEKALREVWVPVQDVVNVAGQF